MDGAFPLCSENWRRLWFLLCGNRDIKYSETCRQSYLTCWLSGENYTGSALQGSTICPGLAAVCGQQEELREEWRKSIAQTFMFLFRMFKNDLVLCPPSAQLFRVSPLVSDSEVSYNK